MPDKRVLSIGQCAADHGAISWTFRQHFGVEVVSADSFEEAAVLLREDDFVLVLVNRILDADGSSGLDVISRLRAGEAWQALPIMLVSNHDDAQRNAVERGAVHGFGKAALGQPHMIERVRGVLS